MKFEDYHITAELKRNIEKLKFKKPTDIQYKCIPAILRREDLLAIAPTGTGKTAAFVIPVLHLLQTRINRYRGDGVKCLVMVPTRELANQITEVFTTMGRSTKLRAFALIGGVDQDPQIAKMQEGIDILVSTPGRMFDMVSQGHLRLDRVQILILDEADHMLDLGFIKDIRDMMRFLPKRRQTLFFSATINDKIKKLAYSLVTNPIRIQVSPKDPISKNIQHAVVYIKMDDKRFFLERIINENKELKIMVFVRTKVRAERVKAALERVDIMNSATMHGGKDQDVRIRTIEKFKSGEINVLIATDVSARGVDVQGVDYVINYDIPDHPETYVHRIGRTGRARLKGNAISFCSDREKEFLDAIQEYIGKVIVKLDVTKFDYKNVLSESKEKKISLDDMMSEIEFFEEKKRKRRKKEK